MNKGIDLTIASKKWHFEPSTLAGLDTWIASSTGKTYEFPRGANDTYTYMTSAVKVREKFIGKKYSDELFMEYLKEIGCEQDKLYPAVFYGFSRNLYNKAKHHSHDVTVYNNEVILQYEDDRMVLSFRLKPSTPTSRGWNYDNMLDVIYLFERYVTFINNSIGKDRYYAA